jgi:hypothetical protein
MDWVYGITQTAVKEANRLFLSGSWGVAASSIPKMVAPVTGNKSANVWVRFVVFPGESISSRLALIGLVLAMSFLVGCATHGGKNAATRPGSGVAEYTQITKEAQKAVSAALDSLNKLAAHTNDCPPNVRASLAHDLERLQVDSLRIRSRAQAIQARGDAYFADWSESIKQIPDPKVREIAERNHPQLEQSFSKIKASSQQAGAAFKPFLSGVRQLHINLESNPSAAGSGSGNELLRTTRDHGEEVLKQLSAVTNQLHEITVLLTPAN